MFDQKLGAGTEEYLGGKLTGMLSVLRQETKRLFGAVLQHNVWPTLAVHVSSTAASATQVPSTNYVRQMLRATTDGATGTTLPLPLCCCFAFTWLHFCHSAYSPWPIQRPAAWRPSHSPTDVSLAPHLSRGPQILSTTKKTTKRSLLWPNHAASCQHNLQFKLTVSSFTPDEWPYSQMDLSKSSPVISPLIYGRLEKAIGVILRIPGLFIIDNYCKTLFVPRSDKVHPWNVFLSNFGNIFFTISDIYRNVKYYTF